jgi:hypothetical protein
MNLPYLVQINVGAATSLLTATSLPRHTQVLHPSLIFRSNFLCLLSKNAFGILDMVVDLTGFPLGPHCTACGSLVLFLAG